MPARRPNIGSAAADLAFALAALASGRAGAPWWAAGLLAAAAILYWAWTRRGALRRLEGARLASSVVLSIALLLGVLGGAYWLGLVWQRMSLT